MIIDYVAAIGAYAFRRVPNSDVDGLLALMDKRGIDLALVSPLEGVLYRNVQAANELHAERLRGRGDRLLGSAFVNPLYPRAGEDARLCLTELGMKALRLCPPYHGYDLDDEAAREGLEAVLTVAEELGAPVSVIVEVEDPREHHVKLLPGVVDFDAVADLFRAWSGVTFVLEQASAGQVAKVHDAAPDSENWLATTSGRSMLGASVHPSLADVIGALGAERLLLGTNMPIQYPLCAFMKIESLGLDEDTLRKVRGGNAARILGL